MAALAEIPVHSYQLHQSDQAPARTLDAAVLATLPPKIQDFAKSAADDGYRLFIKHALSVSGPNGWQADIGRGKRKAWHVDNSTIKQLAQASHTYHRLHKNSPINLTWDHSSSSRDACGDVLGAWPNKAADKLYLLLGTKDEEAAKALSNGMPVSVEASPNHTDGAGNHYPICLTHVALCQRPVVTGQEPAKLLLSNASTSNERGSRMSWKDLFTRVQRVEERLKLADSPFPAEAADGEDAGTVDDDTDPTDAGADSNLYDVSRDATDVPVTAICKLLHDCHGIEFSDNVTNWGEFVAACEHSGEDDGEADDSDKPNPMEGMAEGINNTMDNEGFGGGGAMSTEVDESLRLAQARIDELERENKRFRDAQATAKAKKIEQLKLSFVKELDALCDRGSVVAGERPQVMQLGQNNGWNTAVLIPFNGRRAANTVRLSAANASTSPPFHGLDEPSDDDRKTLGLALMTGRAARKGPILQPKKPS